MQFIGSGGTGNSTQTIGVDLLIADGVLRLNSSGTNLNQLQITGGIRAASASAATLTLAGTSTNDNVISGAITDNGGPVSIVKEGSGDWFLASGANTFSGAVSVRDGALRLSDSRALGAATNIYLGSDGNNGIISYHNSQSQLTLTQSIFLTGDNGGGVFSAFSAINSPFVVAGTITNSGAGLRQLLLVGGHGGASRIESVLADGDGTLKLRKEGAGYWGITNTANSFTGGVEIVTSSLRVDDMRALNFAQNNIRFIGSATNSAFLETSGTLTGNVAASGAGTFTWLGNGGFSAKEGPLDITLNAGATLVWDVDGFVPAGRRLQFNSIIAKDVVELHNSIDLNGDVRTITVRNNAALTSDYAVLSGVISNGGIDKRDGGTLVLSGDNTYAGDTFVSDGSLLLGTTNALGVSTAAVNVGTAAGDVNAGVFTDVPIVVSRNFNVVNGPGSTISFGGAAAVSSTFSGNITFSQTVTLQSVVGGTTNFSGMLDDAGPAPLGIDVRGGGVVVFSGNSLYTGPTTVHEGVFIVNGASSSSDVTIANGGILKGSGAISGVVSVQSGGSLSPGNSIESLAVGGVTLTHGSNLVFEFRHASGSVPGTDWDLIDMSAVGILDLGDATAADPIKLYIDSFRADNSGHGGGDGEGANFNNFDPSLDYEWLFIKSASLSSLTMIGADDFASRFQVIDDLNGAGVFGIDDNNPFARPTSFNGAGTFSAVWTNGADGPGLYVRYSAIPEPSSVVFCALASLVGGLYRRRRRAVPINPCPS